MEFIYKGKLDNSHITAEMLQAASYLGFHQLQLRCEKFLIKQLNVENVSYCLVLAHQVGSTALRDASKELILNNLMQVKVTEGWKTIVSNHPTVLELLL